MSFSNYFFKTSEPEYFIQCQWKKDIDFKVKHNYSVSFVTLTDTNDYWQVEATRDLLLDFKTPNIDSNKLELLLKNAFQGLTSFDEQPIHWKVNKTDTTCELILQCYFDSILLMRIGSLQMKRVLDSEKKSVQKAWFENTTNQLAKHQHEKASYAIYVKNLEESNQKLKEEMKEMILRKNDTEMELMLKFKEIMNAKKLKIRRLIAKNNDFGITSTPTPVIVKKQPKSRKKRTIASQNNDSVQEKEPEPEVRSDPIVDDSNDEDLFDIFEIDHTAPF